MKHNTHKQNITGRNLASGVDSVLGRLLVTSAWSCLFFAVVRAMIVVRSL